jgi:hypothetical protein
MNSASSIFYSTTRGFTEAFGGWRSPGFIGLAVVLYFMAQAKVSALRRGDRLRMDFIDRAQLLALASRSA